MQEFQEDFYQILGVEQTATPDEIRKAYLKLAKKLHPDRFPNDPEKRAEAQAEFAKVTRAHDILSDAKQRDEYDALRSLARRGTVGPDPQATEESTAPAEGGAKLERDNWATKHKDRALDLLKRKKFPEADTAIKEAIRLNPNNATFHAILADINLQRGWRTLAQTSIQQALKLDPKNHEAKDVELRLKSSVKRDTTENSKAAASKSSDASKKGLLDQLKDLLNKKM